MPNDVPDWSTMTFANQLIQIGTGTFVTGGTPPASVDFSFTPSITKSAIFDTFWLIITYSGSSILPQASGSTCQIYLLSQLQNTYKIRYNNLQGKYFEFDLDDETSLLFDSITFHVVSGSFLASTTYTWTAYATNMSQAVHIWNNQLIVGEVDGTITTAGTWQNIYTFTLKPDYILFQNQGTGYMNITFGTVSTPTVTGILILPGGSFISDSMNIPMNTGSGTNYLWVKGTRTGDPFIVLAP